MDEFKKELDEIKNELNEVKLSDEFKQNLKIKMEEEFDKPNIKEKARNILFPRKLIATFACFIFLLTSCAVFADEIESLVTHIFSNTDKKIERAIANGNYKKIDMDYVEHDGIGIKVDYIIQEENDLYIVFDINSKNEMETICFDDIEIKFNDTIIHRLGINKVEVNSTNFSYTKMIEKYKYCIIYKISIDKYKIKNEKINVEINEIAYQNNGEYIRKKGNWVFNIENNKKD